MHFMFLTVEGTSHETFDIVFPIPTVHQTFLYFDLGSVFSH